MAARPVVAVPVSETLDTLDRGETVSDLLARNGVANLDLSRLDSPCPSIRAGSGRDWCSASAGPDTASAPTEISVRTSPEQRVLFQRTGDQWDTVAEPIAWKTADDADPGRHRQLAVRGARRPGGRRPARRRRPAAPGLGPGRRLCVAGGLHPRHPARRPVPGRVRTADLRGRRGPLRPRPRRRPHHVGEEPHRLPLRERRPRGVLRRQRQLAPARVPARPGAVPPDLVDLRSRPVSSRAGHHPAARGHRLRRRAQARRSWPRATASYSAPVGPAAMAT